MIVGGKNLHGTVEFRFRLEAPFLGESTAELEVLEMFHFEMIIIIAEEIQLIVYTFDYDYYYH